MGTKAETIGVPARPAGFTLWTAAVSALTAAALIMSAMALTVAMRDRAVTGVAAGGINEAASTEAPHWNAAKLDAMEGRMVAASIQVNGYTPLWNAAKLDAMEGRMVAASIQVNGYTPLWNAAKLDAMKGRMLAAELEAEGRGLAG